MNFTITPSGSVPPLVTTHDGAHPWAAVTLTDVRGKSWTLLFHDDGPMDALSIAAGVGAIELRNRLRHAEQHGGNA